MTLWIFLLHCLSLFQCVNPSNKLNHIGQSLHNYHMYFYYFCSIDLSDSKEGTASKLIDLFSYATATTPHRHALLQFFCGQIFSYPITYFIICYTRRLLLSYFLVSSNQMNKNCSGAFSNVKLKLDGTREINFSFWIFHVCML